MYPTRIYLLKYKKSFLGKNNQVFGFIKSTSAKTVCDKILYENNVIVTQQGKNKYRIKCVPTTQEREKKFIKPVSKSQLKVISQETTICSFFTSINNINLTLIDDVNVQQDGNIEMHSNFSIENVVPIDIDDIKFHLEQVYNGDKINYTEELHEILLDGFTFWEDDLTE